MHVPLQQKLLQVGLDGGGKGEGEVLGVQTTSACTLAIRQAPIHHRWVRCCHQAHPLRHVAQAQLLSPPPPPPLLLHRRFSRTAVARVSDDYYPRDPASSTPHIGACAFNSLYMGALVQPDWDMFQSAHPAGEGEGWEGGVV